MSDLMSRLSERDLAELCALADGTLPEERRPVVEARVAASAELRALLERQRRAVAATRSLSGEPAPESLRVAVEARRERRNARGRSARLVPRLAMAGALAVLVAVVAAVVLSGGPGGPTVAEAAQLAARPPNRPVPGPTDGNRTKLAVDVEGVVFPDLLRAFGWRAVGVRRDQVDGREATAVYYAKGTRRIAYVIVAGSGLRRPSRGPATTHGGVEYQTLQVNGRQAVTWRRDGHTCVLIGPASRNELLALASY
jgi:anti-sigma factor RsiW